MAVMALAAGCNGSDKWEPGPKDENTGVSAYFEAPSQTSYIFGSDFNVEDMVINLPVKRKVTAGEATVGVSLTSDVEGFQCPSSVVFKDGEDEATLTVKCSEIPNGKMCDFTLMLADDQTNIYGQGLNQLSLSAIKSDWKILAPRARYLYSDINYDAIYPSTSGELYQLEGTMLFKLTDFFGSGLDVTFKCSKPKDDVFYPLQNADFDNVYGEDRNDLGWYLYNEAETDWPTWVPGGVDGYPAISYLLFYSVSDYNVMTMLYDEKNLYGYIGLTAAVTFDDNTFKWGNFQVDFYLDYKPFEK